MTQTKVKEVEDFPPQDIHILKDIRAPPQHPEPFYQNYQSDVPIALDIGTSTWRIGLTNSPEPNNVFPAVVSRYRDRRAMATLTIIGNDVFGDPALKSTMKTPYDGPLITNWDYIEYMLDYSFEHLITGPSDNGRVNNPIIMTEPLTCPFNQRKYMYELLYEAYQVPKTVFGIDSLFSYYANSSGHSDGIVIGGGHESTCVIPVLQGRGIMSQAKRIDWGGDQSQQFLSKLLSLKYPYFPTKLNSHHTTNLFKDYCYISENYQEELKHILDMDVLENVDVVVQAPVEINVNPEKKKSEEELAKQAQKRKEQGKRLQEQAQQKRLEKLAQKKEEWEYYSKFKEETADLPKEELEARLINDGFDDLEDFNKYMTSLERSVKKAEQGGDDEEEHVDVTSAWPLVDIPDDQLSEEQIKEKRKQKLHKANYEARERTKELKRQEEEARIQFEKEQQEWRERDLEDWCTTKRIQLAETISKYKERQKLRESFKDRKSAAAQQRMKNIAELANDETGSTSAVSRKRRRNANTTIDNDPNDTFGANDDDWSIYRDITNTSIEEELSNLSTQITAIEEELLKHDPNFFHEDTFAAATTFDWKNSVLHKFIHGPRPNITIAMQAEGPDPDEIANHPEIIRKNHQIHLNVERIRVPEILFQPNIAGLDQAGISELSSDLVNRRLDGVFRPGGQSYSVVQDVFVTGGLALLPNFTNRLTNDFRSFLPVGTPLKVRMAKDPLSDAWHGMQKWAGSEDCEKGYVTKAEYEEYGPEYIKEHGLGNVCLR
ncbi:ARP5 [[Candida] subhashii]|uniref:ARP5 n=1 Tax=[Candida] subhashii TaxID=561895 RepID=A0A8J5QRF1_9ASCO|nr:ARP5 [[Candida] subhashii]KAG7665784.1 ARP5 [[Candida] subhashii]